MSLANPTPLIVGTTGLLDGRRFRVAGRVVLGVEVEGETYYWNEFNLVDGFGRTATLVFEETEDGPSWKLFELIEPPPTLTVAEAAEKRVGQMVTLDGEPARITLVGQSRVHFIEGTGPDGTEVGDVANYFNVDRGDRMLVASWTGDEIEFYAGRDRYSSEVAEAFGLPKSSKSLSAAAGVSLDPSTRPKTSSTTGCVVWAVLILFGFFSCTNCSTCTISTSPDTTAPATRQQAPAPPSKKPAPTLRLANGAQGSLGQINYTVEGRALVEIARVGSRHDEHEYALASSSESGALLIQGLNGGDKEWHLLLPVTRAADHAGLTPHQAATLRKGAPVQAIGRTFRITSLFQATVRSLEANRTNMTWPNVQYGFIAQDGAEWMVARWTETGIRVYRGRTLPEIEILAALGPGPEKPR